MDQSLENRIREARLRDLDRTWLCARPSRSALACGRAGNLGGIDGRARPRTRPAKEATVACTFEDHQDPRSGQLTRTSHAEIRRHKHRRPVGRVINHFCSRGGRLRFDRAK
jgi:hypothetical protein